MSPELQEKEAGGDSIRQQLLYCSPKSQHETHVDGMGRASHTPLLPSWEPLPPSPGLADRSWWGRCQAQTQCLCLLLCGLRLCRPAVPRSVWFCLSMRSGIQPQLGRGPTALATVPGHRSLAPHSGQSHQKFSLQISPEPGEPSFREPWEEAPQGWGDQLLRKTKHSLLKEEVGFFCLEGSRDRTSYEKISGVPLTSVTSLRGDFGATPAVLRGSSWLCT